MAALSTSKDINLIKLYEKLSLSLPAYAQPLIIRIKNEMETTGTFKHRKVELAKEGYSPKNISEPLYFCDHQSREYIPLDSNLFDRIQNQELKL